MDNVKLIVHDLHNDLLYDCRESTVTMMDSLMVDAINVMTPVLDELKVNDVIYEYKNIAKFTPTRSSITTFIKFTEGSDVILYETIHINSDPRVRFIDIDFRLV